MIRPRSGNFVYTKEELNTMREQIESFLSMPIGGFVMGTLTSDHMIDVQAMKALRSFCQPFPLTFHKAIDVCKNIFQACETIKKHQLADFILSSGGKDTALEGANVLLRMQEIVGNEIQVIAAGKITDQNLNEVLLKTQLTYFHGRRIV